MEMTAPEAGSAGWARRHESTNCNPPARPTPHPQANFCRWEPFGIRDATAGDDERMFSASDASGASTRHGTGEGVDGPVTALQVQAMSSRLLSDASNVGNFAELQHSPTCGANPGAQLKKDYEAATSELERPSPEDASARACLPPPPPPPPPPESCEGDRALSLDLRMKIAARTLATTSRMAGRVGPKPTASTPLRRHERPSRQALRSDQEGDAVRHAGRVPRREREPPLDGVASGARIKGRYCGVRPSGLKIDTPILALSGSDEAACRYLMSEEEDDAAEEAGREGQGEDDADEDLVRHVLEGAGLCTQSDGDCRGWDLMGGGVQAGVEQPALWLVSLCGAILTLVLLVLGLWLLPPLPSAAPTGKLGTLWAAAGASVSAVEVPGTRKAGPVVTGIPHAAKEA